VRHIGSGAPEGTATVTVTASGGIVRVEVADRSGPGALKLRIADSDAEGGRGLQLVGGAGGAMGLAAVWRADGDLVRAAARLNRIGEPILAWAAADRAMAAAESSGEPLLAAVGAYLLSYVFTARNHPREALELAIAAANTLEPAMRAPSPDHLSVYGGLHLAGATAAAATYDRAQTATLISKASAVAERLGANASLMGTAFGPVNVAIHTISTSLRFGDARTAAEIGESLDTAAIPAGLVGRRTQVHLDLAHAYALRRQDAAAVNILLTAESLSPQLGRYDGRTRELLTEVLRREHRPSTPELRPLAHRVGVI
jgi:hypothetical protein